VISSMIGVTPNRLDGTRGGRKMNSVADDKVETVSGRDVWVSYQGHRFQFRFPEGWAGGSGRQDRFAERVAASGVGSHIFAEAKRRNEATSQGIDL
jgi:hypothetical protein